MIVKSGDVNLLVADYSIIRINLSPARPTPTVTPQGWAPEKTVDAASGAGRRSARLGLTRPVMLDHTLPEYGRLGI